LKVEVAYGGPEGEAVDVLDLATGATVADALARSSLPLRLGLDPGSLSFAIFGQRARASTPLRDGDRVELLRRLVADPKDVRRRRAAENPLPKSAPKPRRPPSGR
jgi:putative ubiquitin-RnfH superfamily antitoxin RatB of RatAB toxin-antitoxin module